MQVVRQHNDGDGLERVSPPDLAHDTPEQANRLGTLEHGLPVLSHDREEVRASGHVPASELRHAVLWVLGGLRLASSADPPYELATVASKPGVTLPCRRKLGNHGPGNADPSAISRR